jgi:enoyl-CoA hydratase/carnithine racemase
LACDFRFADRTATIGIPAAKLSIIYGVHSVQRLLALTGVVNAKRILYSAERYPAERAMSMGLIDEIHDEAVLAAERFLERLADNARFRSRQVHAEWSFDGNRGSRFDGGAAAYRCRIGQRGLQGRPTGLRGKKGSAISRRMKMAKQGRKPVLEGEADEACQV